MIEKWPGLAAETATIYQELGIEDCYETCVHKKSHKNMMMKACHKKIKAMFTVIGKGQM